MQLLKLKYLETMLWAGVSKPANSATALFHLALIGCSPKSGDKDIHRY